MIRRYVLAADSYATSYVMILCEDEYRDLRWNGVLGVWLVQPMAGELRGSRV